MLKNSHSKYFHVAQNRYADWFKLLFSCLCATFFLLLCSCMCCSHGLLQLTLLYWIWVLPGSWIVVAQSPNCSNPFCWHGCMEIVLKATIYRQQLVHWGSSWYTGVFNVSTQRVCESISSCMHTLARCFHLGINSCVNPPILLLMPGSCTVKSP